MRGAGTWMDGWISSTLYQPLLLNPTEVYLHYPHYIMQEGILDPKRGSLIFNPKSRHFPFNRKTTRIYFYAAPGDSFGFCVSH